MLIDIFRFNREAMDLANRCGSTVTLNQLLEAGDYGSEFIDQYLVPMAAAIWSANPQTIGDIPAYFFVRFFHNHGLLGINDRPQWRVVQGGSQQYVRKLTDEFKDRIRLRSPVHRIDRFQTHVVIHVRGQEPEKFDAVFISCHSDQAIRMLSQATRAERDILKAIPYQANTAVLHTDSSVMPLRNRAWAAWNYCIPEEIVGNATVTYYLNQLMSLDSETQYFVTLNDDQRIDPDRIVERIRFSHPVFTAEGIAAQGRLEEINGRNRTYFCGAYWGNGFHEDGVVSANRALKTFNQQSDHAQRYLQRAS